VGHPSQADGPAAEIALLKNQVDKLSKALSYSLAELHRRGYDTLRFDWKELVFVDPSAQLQSPQRPCQSNIYNTSVRRVLEEQLAFMAATACIVMQML
jgi:hypothetical protein